MNPNREKQGQYHSLQLPSGQQQGFVLVLVLVLLAALTLIGVSSMNSSNMELKATANARQHQAAFNAVQSLLEYAVSTRTPVLIDFQTTSLVEQKVDHTISGGASLQASAVYAGCASGIGSSLEEGKGFSNNYFNITGTGTNTTGTSSSTQVQGVRFPAAACN